MCRRFTGPHSVLQIFLEKIIACISKMAIRLKDAAKNELSLWEEVDATKNLPAKAQQK
jgi:hypothetical protein